MIPTIAIALAQYLPMIRVIIEMIIVGYLGHVMQKLEETQLQLRLTRAIISKDFQDSQDRGEK